jgi:CBS domain-containing protein
MSGQINRLPATLLNFPVSRPSGGIKGDALQQYTRSSSQSNGQFWVGGRHGADRIDGIESVEENRFPYGLAAYPMRSLGKNGKLSTASLCQAINQATDMDSIRVCQNQLPWLLRNMSADGADTVKMTYAITAVSDALANKIIQLALEALGRPPARFVFMIVGSQGRGEQTLKTDQDNAIIYDDACSNNKTLHDYFIQLGQRVCKLLNQAGYAYCQGDVMANNHKWCQSLSTWKAYFSNWIHTAESQDLLQASIFFDFKGAYGDSDLIDALRRHLFEQLNSWPGFFRHLAENAVTFDPPRRCFHNFRLKSTRRRRETVDIKQAMMPIVDIARIYALCHHIQETNTWRRLHHLRLKEVLSRKEANELATAYRVLMQLRLSHQVNATITGESEPNNCIDPRELTRIEQAMIKEAIRQVKRFQSKLKVEFMGCSSDVSFAC